MKLLVSRKPTKGIAVVLAILAIASWAPNSAFGDEPNEQTDAKRQDVTTEAAPTLTVPIPPSIVITPEGAPQSAAATKTGDAPTAAATKTGDAPTAAATKTGDAPTTEGATADVPKTASAPEYHVVQMRLSGSMCFSCLKDLDEGLQRIRGVLQVKIDRPERNYYQPYAPEVSSWAVGTVYYDASLLPLDALRAEIKDRGYHPYKVVDKPSEKPSDTPPAKKK